MTNQQTLRLEGGTDVAWVLSGPGAEKYTLINQYLGVICHEDGTTGWPATRDHLFGSLGMIGGRGAGVN